MRVRGILLAAGSGTRFGGEKMLARMPNGNQLGVTSYKNLLHAIPETSVVVNSEDTKTLKLFSSINAEIIECPEAKIGMAKSIIAGISLSPPCDGWVIALGDMPFISIETIKAVKRKLNEGALLTAPRFQGQ